MCLMTSPPGSRPRPVWAVDVTHPQVIYDAELGVTLGFVLRPDVAAVIVLCVNSLLAGGQRWAVPGFDGWLRQGQRVPHHVYHQLGDRPDRQAWPAGDEPVGMFADPLSAELACRGVNLRQTVRLMP